MNPRIAYFGHHGFTELMIAVHKVLAADGTAAPDPAFILFNGYWRRRVRSSFPDAAVAMLPNRLDWWRLRKNPPTVKPDDDFQRAWRLDKMLRGRPAADVLALWAETRERFAGFLDAARPAILVSELIQSLPCYALFLECRRRGIPYVQLCGSRVRGGMEYYLGEECQPAFINTTEAPSERAISLARSMITEVREKAYAGPAYMKIQRKASYFSLADVRKTVDYLLERLHGGWLEPNTKPFWHPFVSKLRGRKKFSGDSFRDYCVGTSEVEKIHGRKLLFPLHVTPEASTDLWSSRYADMVETAEMIVEHLPLGWTLIMKEHPAALYIQRSDESIKALKAVPRSIIVSPDLSNDWLMKHSSATVVITGTFGLEALMKNIPVITIGRPFYDASGQTIPCPDLQGLPSALDAVQARKVNEDAVLRFIAHYADAVDPGLPANTRLFPTLLNETNIRNIAAGISRRFLSRGISEEAAS